MGIRIANLAVFASVALAPPAYSADAVRSAIDFLARETPRWQPENHCFSCHNNGDAARALLFAKARGYSIPPDALTGTIAWLQKPEAWDEDRSNPAFADRKLARIQFSAALAEAVRSGLRSAHDDLTRAAESLVALQEHDGAWKIDTGGVSGAPATYGSVLATYMARQALATADPSRFEAAIASANRWLLAASPANVLDRAAILLALPDTAGKHLEPLLAAQNSDGGWGPQPHAPSEAFDTAVALLALRGAASAKPAAAIARGRGFLTKFQLSDGPWPETTRPSGFTSYAERISTAGWAAYALLATDAEVH
jgi:hypothetical protein